MVWENPNIKVFDNKTDNKTVDRSKASWLSPLNSHQRHTIILCVIFFMYVATIQPLNYRGQESKHSICSLYFWHTCGLKTKSRSSNLQWKCRPRARLYPCKVWKISLYLSPRKKTTLKFVFWRGDMSSSSHEHIIAKIKKQRYIHGLQEVIRQSHKGST